MSNQPVQPDPRNLSQGREIPVENYCDQPYVIRTSDGAWLCTLTTGPGKEGHPGQHVICMRSTDQGRTWGERVDLEPADGPESSYSVLLQTPAGRVYCFYNHNTDNVREIVGDEAYYHGRRETRVDSLGYFVFKYSDDQGRTWSQQRHVVPIRAFAIDRENPYGGNIRFGWNVGKAFVLREAAYVPFHKVGSFGEGLFSRSEGVLLRSDNLLTERDPARIRWETLPDGDIGLRAPAGGGPIAEEQSCVPLSDGSLYCIYRTIAGSPAFSISRDGGHTWSQPRFLAYADGRSVRHPRAANFVWKCANGKYLYWFHNNGWNGYNNLQGSGSRNVAWLSGGVERDGGIAWSQPETVLYGEDFFQGPSYPDLIEEDGRYFLTETQKTVARVHELDRGLLESLWSQLEAGGCGLTRDGLLLELPGIVPACNQTVAAAAGRGEADPRPAAAATECGTADPRPSVSAKATADKPAAATECGATAAMPPLPEFVTRDYWAKGPGRVDLNGGFSLELVVQLDSLAEGQVLLDSRDAAGAGLALVTTARGTLELLMHDGRGECRWDCDPGAIRPGARHHVVVSIDGGPRLIQFLIDGRLCDGAGRRMYGWGRFSPVLRHANGAPQVRIAPRLQGKIWKLRIYGRCLHTGEAVANAQAEGAKA
jgi:hypothetical protein